MSVIIGILLCQSKGKLIGVGEPLPLNSTGEKGVLATAVVLCLLPATLPIRYLELIADKADEGMFSRAVLLHSTQKKKKVFGLKTYSLNDIEKREKCKAHIFSNPLRLLWQGLD